MKTTLADVEPIAQKMGERTSGEWDPSDRSPGLERSHLGDDPLVCTKNSDSDVLVMQPTEQRTRDDAPDLLDRARDRSIFVQRPVSSGFIVQLDNITPIGPKSGKFFILGIRGLAGGSSFTK